MLPFAKSRKTGRLTPTLYMRFIAMALKLPLRLLLTCLTLSIMPLSAAASLAYDPVYGSVSTFPLNNNNATLVYGPYGRAPQQVNNNTAGISWYYSYDPAGSRTVKIENNNTVTTMTTEVFDGLAEFSDDGQVRYHLPGLVYSVDGALYTPILDHKSSSRVLLNDAQATVAQYDYDTLGQVYATVDNGNCAMQDCQDEVAGYDRRWEGLELISLAGDNSQYLVDNHARLYAAQTGLFLHRDAVPETPSPYASRIDDPVNYNDPDGNTVYPARGRFDRQHSVTYDEEEWDGQPSGQAWRGEDDYMTIERRDSGDRTRDMINRRVSGYRIRLRVQRGTIEEIRRHAPTVYIHSAQEYRNFYNIWLAAPSCMRQELRRPLVDIARFPGIFDVITRVC